VKYAQRQVVEYKLPRKLKSGDWSVRFLHQGKVVGEQRFRLDGFGRLEARHRGVRSEPHPIA